MNFVTNHMHAHVITVVTVNRNKYIVCSMYLFLVILQLLFFTDYIVIWSVPAWLLFRRVFVNDKPANLIIGQAWSLDVGFSKTSSFRMRFGQKNNLSVLVTDSTNPQMTLNIVISNFTAFIMSWKCFQMLRIYIYR